MLNVIMLLALFLCSISPVFSISTSTDWIEYRNSALEEQKNFAGWCPQEKAKRMMDLIYNNSCKICIEVGVYGGSSFFPIAATLAFTKQGMGYAIDPWYNDACLEGYEKGADAKMFDYWGKIDLEKAMQKFIKNMSRNDLDSNYTIMRLRSSEAAPLFEDASIDFLHIDGNHSEEASVNDVKTWLPKVKSGGIICFDDAWWQSTQKAILILRQSCEILKNESSIKGQYIFLRKQ